MASQGLKLAREALEASATYHTTTDLDTWRKDELGALERGRKACAGGMDAVRELNFKGDGEMFREYELRLLNARNIPLCHIGLETFADMMSGTQPAVKVWVGDEPLDLIERWMLEEAGETVEDDEVTENIQNAVDAVVSGLWECHRKMIYRRGRDGHCAVKLYPYKADPSERLGEVLGWRFAVFNREDVRLVMHPDDPTRIIAAFEYRSTSKSWRYWDSEQWMHVSADFTPMGVGDTHDFGAVPFAVLGEPLPGTDGSLIRNALEYQKELNARESIRWTGTRSEVWPIEWGSGRLVEEIGTEGDQGQRGKSAGGPGRRLWLEADTSGNPPNLQALSKNLPLGEMRTDSEAILREGFQMMRLPADFITGIDSPAEQPTTLLLRLYPTMVRYKGLSVEAAVFWDQMMPLIKRAILSEPVTDQYEIGPTGTLTADEIQHSVTYADNPFPHSDGAQRLQDRADVLDGLMSPAEYIVKYRKPKTIHELRRMLEAYKAKNTIGTFGDFTLPNEPPGFGREPKEDEKPTDELDFNALTLGAQRLGSVGDVEGFNALREEALRRLDRKAKPVRDLKRPEGGA